MRINNGLADVEISNERVHKRTREKPISQKKEQNNYSRCGATEYSTASKFSSVVRPSTVLHLSFQVWCDRVQYCIYVFKCGASEYSTASTFSSVVRPSTVLHLRSQVWCNLDVAV